MKDTTCTRVTLKMQCRDCGHIQIVKGFRAAENDGVYFGSAYNWCTRCDLGLPVAIEDLKEAE